MKLLNIHVTLSNGKLVGGVLDELEVKEGKVCYTCAGRRIPKDKLGVVEVNPWVVRTDKFMVSAYCLEEDKKATYKKCFELVVEEFEKRKKFVTDHKASISRAKSLIAKMEKGK